MLLARLASSSSRSRPTSSTRRRVVRSAASVVLRSRRRRSHRASRARSVAKRSPIPTAHSAVPTRSSRTLLDDDVSRIERRHRRQRPHLVRTGVTLIVGTSLAQQLAEVLEQRLAGLFL